ncbi:8159_t:CDS:2 [Entrophospora sp. SA101]|nr:11263_t:CDS:2 [Entrophospora sp. SA101]CAJ0823335.1 8159_t:CDS:2 [Entrophospora sp. SA101]
MSIQTFETSHEDLIHDVSYDFYGRRLVSCSSDQKLKVWDFNQETNEWELNHCWKAHECSILRAVWAHPEFGQVIASCSFDRSVKIWEEEHEPKEGGKRWAERATLVESRGSVQDIEFAPNCWGLKLATCAADGMLRIFEALEVNNLLQWSLMGEAEITPGISTKEAERNYCISWCPSRTQLPMIAVGCSKENCVKIFRPDSQNQWRAYEILNGHLDVVHDVSWAPNMGRSYHLIATASKDTHVRIFKLTEKKDVYEAVNVSSFPDHKAEVWKVEWNYFIN